MHNGKTLVRLPKLHPLSKQGQRDYLTPAQRCLRAWFWPLWLSFRLEKIVYHDVQCCYEGIQIDLKLAPFLTNWFDKLTLRPGFLLYQVLSISHQTFKLSIFGEVSWRGHCSCFGLSRQFLRNRTRIRSSHQ